MWIWTLIVRAAPTCTLWEYDWKADCYRFRFNRRWIVTETQRVQPRSPSSRKIKFAPFQPDRA